MRSLLRHAIARFAVRLFFEVALVLGVVVAIAYVLSGGPGWEVVADAEWLPKLLLVAFVCQLSLYTADFYRCHLVADQLRLFARIAAALGASLWILAATYFWFPASFPGWRVSLATGLFVFTLIVVWRLSFGRLCRGIAHRDRLLLVGTGHSAIALARELFDRRHRTGVDIVGFIDNSRDRVGTPIINPGVIGIVEDIPRLVRAHSVDRVVVSWGDESGQPPVNALLAMRLDGVAVDDLASVYERYTGKIPIEGFRPSSSIVSPVFQQARSSRAAQRGFDLSSACVALVALSPVLMLTALAVKLTSRGPVLYHQQRVGLHGRVFWLHKFRSMDVGAESETGPVWARPGDDRVTAIGGFLRRTRLDELPQLWNILVGEMSLVGPRPERTDFMPELTRRIPFYGQRHAVRPGLTGWAQVRYPYGASVEDAAEKLKYDLFYIKNRSLVLDAFILVATLKIVAFSRGW